MKHVDVSAPNVMRPNYAPNLPAARRRRQRVETEIEGHLARVEILLARLDRQDGDPDLEDATDAEDDFTFSPLADRYRRTLGAGCPISDPPGLEGAEDDGWLSPQAAQYADLGPGCRISDPDDERI